MSWSLGRLLELGALLAACLWAAWSLRHLWAPGPVAGWDSLGHLLKATVLDQQLLPSGRLDGWFPYWHSGFDLFQFYPPGYYDLVVAVHRLSLGSLGLVEAVKLVIELALLMPAAGLWLLAAALGWPALSRVGAATFGLVAGSSYGGGPVGTFVVGLQPNALGIGLATLTLAAMAWMWRPAAEPATVPAPRPWMRPPVLACGLGLGLLLQTHALSTTFVALCLVAGALVEGWPEGAGWRRGPLLAAASALLIGVALGASWWLPVLAGFSQHGALGTWVLPDPSQLWTGLWDGSLLGDGVLAGSALVGAVVLVVRRRRQEWTVLLWLLLALLLSSGVLARALSSAQALSQYVRYQAYLAVLAALLAGGAWGLLAERLGRLLGGRRIVAPLLAAAVLLACFAVEVAPHHASVVDGSLRLQPEYPGSADALAAMRWLDGHSPPGARLLSEFSYGALPGFGSAHLLDELVPLEAHRFELGGNFPEGTPASVAGVVAGQNLADQAFFASAMTPLRPWGVVTYLPSTADALRSRPELIPVHSNGEVRVWRVSLPPPAGQPSLDGWRWAPDHWSVLVGARASALWVLLPVGYHPRWAAAGQWSAAAVRESPGHLLEVRLPAGSAGDLELSLGLDSWQLVGGLFSLATAAALLASWVRGGRRKASPSP